MAKRKNKKLKLKQNKLNTMLLTGFIVAFGLIGIIALSTSYAQSRDVDMSLYYPNTKQYEKNYLEGFNYISGNPERSVLWFEKQDQWTFRAYNSGPEDLNSRCHWDELSWWDDGTLRYSKTHHECPGSTPNEIVYDSPIIFIPKNWSKDDGSWRNEGSAAASYYENGQLRCTGTNNYIAEIIGEEEIAPDKTGIHWRTTQTTDWETGDVQGKCFEGYTTRWQEDYWLSTLTLPNGREVKGLKRSLGGNLDNNNSSWDVWFDSWEKLP